MQRVQTGMIGHFDSIEHIRGFCRAVYGALEVQLDNIDDEVVLIVRPRAGPPFYSLLAHFDGSQSFVVMLPLTDAPDHMTAELQRWTKSRRRGR